jgi:quercetin dioxygenase-like cupin family protein
LRDAHRALAAKLHRETGSDVRLSLYDEPGGVETGPGNRVVYDLERNEAWFGAARVDGHALRWDLEEEPRGGALLSREVSVGPDWLMRCDRVDFPPGGVAYSHTHPGPGIRCLLHGRIRIESEGETREYGPLEPWFESGPEPVFAAASESEETAFVRVMLLPSAWAGKRTISYVDPGDADKPRTQRATVLLERPLEP